MDHHDAGRPRGSAGRAEAARRPAAPRHRDRAHHRLRGRADHLLPRRERRGTGAGPSRALRHQDGDVARQGELQQRPHLLPARRRRPLRRDPRHADLPQGEGAHGGEPGDDRARGPRPQRRALAQGAGARVRGLRRRSHAGDGPARRRSSPALERHDLLRRSDGPSRARPDVQRRVRPPARVPRHAHRDRGPLARGRGCGGARGAHRRLQHPRQQRLRRRARCASAASRRATTCSASTRARSPEDGRFRKIEVRVKGPATRSGHGAGTSPPCPRARLPAAPQRDVDPVLQQALDASRSRRHDPAASVVLRHERGRAQPHPACSLAVDADVSQVEFRDVDGQPEASLDTIAIVAHRDSGEVLRSDQKVEIRRRAGAVPAGPGLVLVPARVRGGARPAPGQARRPRSADEPRGDGGPPLRGGPQRRVPRLDAAPDRHSEPRRHAGPARPPDLPPERQPDGPLRRLRRPRRRPRRTSGPRRARAAPCRPDRRPRCADADPADVHRRPRPHGPVPPARASRRATTSC